MMKKFTFPGGAHPNDNKAASRYFKIETIPAPKTLVLPLSQHIGARANPIVKEGESVRKGQKIAEAKGHVSANIHSPVSGKVVEIRPSVHPSGMLVDSIIIENDGKNTTLTMKGLGSLQNLSPQAIRDAVFEAGIVGLGGAAFPTHVKLNPPAGSEIKHCIINGAECEPYLTSDHRIMLEHPEKVIRGCLAIMRATGAGNGYIAIEKNKEDAIEAFKQYTKSIENISVVALETKYPQGSEKQLIKTIIGKEVPPTRLPLDVGAVVNNVGTCMAISDCLETGTPLISRVITVCGGAFSHSQNYVVPIGTPVSHIIEHHGGFATTPNRVVIGGPMMGAAQCTFDVPIIKGSGGILALTKKEVEKERETACIRCGRCVLGCPVRLQPTNLMKYAIMRNTDALRDQNIADCIECGVCTYECPAKIHLLQHIKTGKVLVADNLA